MRIRRNLGLFMLSVLSFSILGYSEVHSISNQEFVDVLIGFNEEVDESRIIEEGGYVKYDFTSIDAVAASVPEDAIEELSLDPDIAFIEYDAPVYALGHTSSVLEYQNSWGVDHIEADKVHANGNKGSAVRICILDTGIDYNHPDLAPNYKGGKDFINGDNDPKDDHGHGTHVAGIASAVLDGTGVVGAAPEAHLYVGKILARNGTGSISDVIAGIEWCVDQHVKIISMSIGSDEGSIAWKAALDAAYSDGVLLVAAAGNSGNCAGTGNNVKYPARYASVIAVAAIDQDNDRECFSATGSPVEISAPGDFVRSTRLNGGYAFLRGTSMATPHVSGSAALVWLSDETVWAPVGYTNGDGIWNNGEIRTVLDKTAEDLGRTGRDKEYGYGLVRPDLVTAAGAASIITRTFDSFSANVIAKIGCDITENKLEVKGTFSLGEENNEQKILKEPVTMIVGPFGSTIPSDAFKLKTAIIFKGEIDNIQTKMKIKELEDNNFRFRFEANALNLSWIDGDPLLVKLNINNIGKMVVTPQIQENCEEE